MTNFRKLETRDLDHEINIQLYLRAIDGGGWPMIRLHVAISDRGWWRSSWFEAWPRETWRIKEEKRREFTQLGATGVVSGR